MTAHRLVPASAGAPSKTDEFGAEWARSPAPVAVLRIDLGTDGRRRRRYGETTGLSEVGTRREAPRVDGGTEEQRAPSDVKW